MTSSGVSAARRIERSAIRPAHRVFLPCLIAAALGCHPASAATPAGTRISNTATMASGPAATRVTQSSNATVLTTAELLDVAIAAASTTLPVAGGATEIAVPFLVTDLGNGNEPLRVAAALVGAPAGVTIKGIVLDTDTNGAYDASIDLAVDPAGVAATPGQQRRVFVLVDVPATLAGNVTVSASVTAATGSGAPGTVFAGAGDNGGDAVVGKTGATAGAQTALQFGDAAPTLVKSQSVAGPDGSARVTTGSTITYTLEARFPAADAAVQVADAIPAGTRYVAGSLTLDDQPLSDAADSDAGSFDGAAIHVALGDVPGAIVRTIRFKTIIQ